ncbi:MAG: UPF0280 family protein [Thermodesulfobacteriota bacterium]
MTGITLFEPRTYRDFGKSGRFEAFRVVVDQSDLYVKAHRKLEKETYQLLRECRAQVEDAIARRKDFLTSLVPIDEDPRDGLVATRMVRAGKKAGTGPMAAVAGAVADFVGQGLLQWSPEVIVENGGDIFVKVDEPMVVGIFAGPSPFANRIGLQIEPTVLGLGLCTSSASVGHSLSLGAADAATVISRDVPLADAVATGLANQVKTPNDLQRAVEWAMSIPGVDGALAIIRDRIAAQGNVELVDLSAQDKEMSK